MSGVRGDCDWDLYKKNGSYGGIIVDVYTTHAHAIYFSTVPSFAERTTISVIYLQGVSSPIMFQITRRKNDFHCIDVKGIKKKTVNIELYIDNDWTLGSINFEIIHLYKHANASIQYSRGDNRNKENLFSARVINTRLWNNGSVA